MTQRTFLIVVLGTVSAALSQQHVSPTRLTLEARLDATKEDLPTVSRIYVGPRGELVVPIISDMQLRVYDSTGRRIASVGRRGAGPGEFLGIASVGWLGDTLWVVDQQQRRTVFFDSNFNVVRTSNWQDQALVNDEPISFFSPVAYAADGSTLGQGLVREGSTSPSASVPVLALRSSQGITRVVSRLLSPQQAPWMIWAFGFPRKLPFALPTTFAFSHDGSRFGQLSAPIPTRHDAFFNITLMKNNGDTLFSKSFGYRGQPIPESAIDSALAAFIPSGRTMGPPDLPQQFQRLARDRMPKWYTASETILLGLDKTIWIGMRQTPAGRAYMVLSEKGDSIGSLVVPAGTQLRQATLQRLWVTETDGDGLSSVVRYKVSGLACMHRC